MRREWLLIGMDSHVPQFMASRVSHYALWSYFASVYRSFFPSVIKVSTCHFREGLDGGITKYRVFEVHWSIPDFLARLNNLKSGVRCWESVRISTFWTAEANFNLYIDDWTFYNICTRWILASKKWHWPWREMPGTHWCHFPPYWCRKPILH